MQRTPRRQSVLRASLMLGLLVPPWWLGLPAAHPDPNGKPDPATAAELARQAVSLLKQRCAGCHGDDAKSVQGGLDLRTRAAALRGGKSRLPVLVPGSPEKSRLLLAVTGKDPDLVMPPKKADRLSAAEVELLRRWIAAGPPWLDTPQPAVADAGPNT